METTRQRVVIIGAGFGGLFAARALTGQPVDVLLIDRNNYHSFTPLLYQVATSGLEPEQIAFPVRGIFRGRTNIRFLLGEVTGIDTDRQHVLVQTPDGVREEAYDYLIVAGGTVTNFYDDESLEAHALGLKDLSEAIALRHHILKLFEQAAWTDDPATCRALMTFVVVGGGPTGLELYRDVLRHDYGHMEDLQARVVLVEAADRLLLPYPATLQDAALEQLRSLGVEVILGNPVAEAHADHIVLKDGTRIDTHTLIWSAGVKGSPLAQMLGIELAQGGRVPVEPTMTARGLENVYVVGDLAYLLDERGRPYPMLIPFAQQSGTLAARNILRRIEGRPQAAFRYNDRGMMATIGRNRAVAWIYNRIPVSGFLAWLAWLGLHLITLLGFRNRLTVFISWVWNYLTYDRSVRIILQPRRTGQAQVEQESVRELVR